jgi:solute carrier family 45 protein 1/2/4
MLALVWIAGPLSGVLVQPYVGLKSDNCRITWGKRRPFILGGAIATIASLMLLGWAREIVGGIGKLFGADGENTYVVNSTMVFAVLLVYVLDFAINVIQAAIRAYIVDVAPTHQQESANAWLMRSAGVGNIAGYLAGYINLPLYLPFLGDTQFKVLCAIASLIMALTVGISCTAGERDPTRDPPPAEQKEGVIAFFKGLSRSVKRLPDQIKRVCEVQFFAWIGWFPFLFYITTYVGEIYADPFFEANPHMSEAEIDQVWEDATRIGTRALLVFAVTTFLCSVIFPFIIPPSFQAPEPEPEPPTPGTPMRPTTPLTPATPHSMGGTGYFTIRKKRKEPAKTRMEKFSAALDKLQIKSLTLRRCWFISHILFAVLMGLTFVIKSTLGATVLVGAIGVPWCLTGWAPFSIIASEISKRDAIRRGAIKPASEEEQAVAEGADAGDADSAGVVLGIHNVAIAAPQVIATLVSSIIFRALQRPRGVAGDDSVAWVLRFGGLCAIIAAWLTLRIHEEKDRDVEEDEVERPTRRRRLSELSNMTSVLEGQSGR